MNMQLKIMTCDPKTHYQCPLSFTGTCIMPRIFGCLFVSCKCRENFDYLVEVLQIVLSQCGPRLTCMALGFGLLFRLQETDMVLTR